MLSELSQNCQQQLNRASRAKCVEETTKSSIQVSIPAITQQNLTDLKTSISNSVTNAVIIIKNDILKKLENDQTSSERIAEPRGLCEAEKLETYNRRENIKVFTIRE